MLGAHIYNCSRTCMTFSYQNLCIFLQLRYLEALPVLVKVQNIGARCATADQSVSKVEQIPRTLHLQLQQSELRQFLSFSSQLCCLISKYMGVLSMYPISSLGQSYPTLTAGRLSSFAPVQLAISKQSRSSPNDQVILHIYFCAHTLVPLKNGLVDCMTAAALSIMQITLLEHPLHQFLSPPVRRTLSLHLLHRILLFGEELDIHGPTVPVFKLNCWQMLFLALVNKHKCMHL